MEREQALQELKIRNSSDSILQHALAVEAIMRIFGRYFKDDEEKWAITGLLHDIDYEKTKGDPSTHGLEAGNILEDLGADESIIYAIKAHNDLSGLERKRRLDKVLYSADSMAELLAECVAISDSKRLEDINEEFVMEKINEDDFAKDVNREQIKACSEFGFDLKEFIKMTLTATRNIETGIKSK